MRAKCIKYQKIYCFIKINVTVNKIDENKCLHNENIIVYTENKDENLLVKQRSKASEKSKI